MKNFVKIKRSVKESYDNLPTGLCFAYASGVPILINHKMYQMSMFLTQMELQNIEAFWEFLSGGTLTNGVTRVYSSDNQVVLKLKKESYTIFYREFFMLDGKRITQISCSDVSTYYVLAEQIAENNKKLKALGERLKAYGENVQELSKKQEYLDTKIRVHDQLGHALNVTRQAIEHKQEDGQAILDMWQQLVDTLLLKSEPKPKESMWQALFDAAKAVQVELLLEGPLPRDAKANETMVICASELLNNAVRHAKATKLWIHLEETEAEWMATFENNGLAPKVPLRFGGGLSNLQQMLQRQGGTVEISSQPTFKAKIHILKGGEPHCLSPFV